MTMDKEERDRLKAVEEQVSVLKAQLKDMVEKRFDKLEAKMDQILAQSVLRITCNESKGACKETLDDIYGELKDIKSKQVEHRLNHGRFIPPWMQVALVLSGAIAGAYFDRIIQPLTK